ncbi:MAG: MoaD/ThiS family protein [Chloroflexota bacterium]|jgi:sulfur carrier protein ThiS
MSKGSIQIHVKLYALLRQYRPETAVGLPHHPFTLTLPPNTTIAGLAHHLGIPDGFVNAAAVNKTAVSPTTPLNDGDEVSLFPPAAGG